MASLMILPRIHSLIHVNKTNSVSDINLATLSVSKQTFKRVCNSCRVSASLSLSNTHSSSGVIKEEKKRTEAVNISGKVDEWIKESMADIVKNLKQAPLLVHVYDGEGEVKIKTENAVVQDWPVVKCEWENGEERSPDGLIFIEELGTEEEEEEEEEESEEGMTKAFGIVVQGKGVECSPACYLLKTSRVGAGLGMGLFCTHFCLARVQNFRDGAFVQFKDSWLL